MSMERILESVRDLDGVFELAPAEGSEFPEIAWGDHFFYYAPDGQLPQRSQPYATIVTKDYPGDTLSDLDPPGRWRLNIHVGRTVFAELFGDEHRHSKAPRDVSAADVVVAHPVYGYQGWIAIVEPGERTTATAIALLRGAHDDARRRAVRRATRVEGEPEPGTDQ